MCRSRLKQCGIAIVAALSVLLTSCGGGSGSSDNTTVSPAGESSSSDNSALPPTTTITRDISSLQLDATNDTNSDGIRDDVSDYIDATFSQTSTELDAARTYARNINSYSTSINSQEAGVRATELQKAIECIYLYLPENSEGTAARNMISSLEGETINTKERAKTWFETDALLSKLIFHEINPTQSDCF